MLHQEEGGSQGGTEWGQATNGLTPSTEHVGLDIHTLAQKDLCIKWQ